MSRQTYVYRDGKMVLKSEAAPLHSGPAFHYISDHMDALPHPCDGKIYDSKSQFRKVTRANGCFEVGNEKIPPRRAPERPRAAPFIKQAIDQLRSR